MATIRKRANRWQVQVRRKNAPNISRSFVKKADADTWARSMEVEADRRTLKHDPRLLDELTLGDLVTRYRDTICQTKKGAEVETFLLNAFLRQSLNHKSLSSISVSDFAAYRDERLKTISASGFNRELAPLQHMFSIARSEWGIPILENPVALLRKPQNNPPRERRLRSGEYAALIEAAEKAKNKYLKPSIIIAVETAMRRGEILNVRQRDFGEALRTLRIPVTKTGRARSIALTSDAVAAFESLLEAFSTEEAGPIIPVSPNAFRLAWERTVKRAKLDDLHFHDLRHEAVSRLFERGLSMPEVASISGHRDYRMLARYAHVGALKE